MLVRIIITSSTCLPAERFQCVVSPDQAELCSTGLICLITQLKGRVCTFQNPEGQIKRWTERFTDHLKKKQKLTNTLSDIKLMFDHPTSEEFKKQ